jgi:desulfoferrodoxin (superoxide reductase-like protein)
MRKLVLAVVSFLLLFSFQAGLAFAGKSAASIDAPQTAQKGSEITIKVTVTHSANNMFHYTQWLKVMANQREIARWDYTSGNRPEAAVFTKEIKVNALEDLEVTAEASCNMHGSAGVATAKISVRD